MGRKEKGSFCYKQDTDKSSRNGGVGERIEGMVRSSAFIYSSSSVQRTEGRLVEKLPQSCPSEWS